jgi:excisionase family DNA binding protein
VKKDRGQDSDTFFTRSGSSPGQVLDPQNILTLQEVAARLKTSPRFIYEKTRRRCQDPLPCVRVGRYLRFIWSDVSAWLIERSTNRRAA